MKRVLFVCMGNICRSPAAEGFFAQYVKQHGLEQEILCDSAGTIGYHEGSFPDSRMRDHALKRGINLIHRSRKFHLSDFKEFDLILVMDQANFRDVEALEPEGLYKNKVFYLTDFCTHLKSKEVPDPYYGGNQGFEHVLDLIEDACPKLLEKVKSLHAK